MYLYLLRADGTRFNNKAEKWKGLSLLILFQSRL